MRLRYRSCANGLNRSSQQNEKTLAKRLARDLPETAEPQTDLASDVTEPDAWEILRQAQAEIDSFTNRLSGARLAGEPLPNPASEKAKPRHASHIVQALVRMAMQDQPEATD